MSRKVRQDEQDKQDIEDCVFGKADLSNPQLTRLVACTTILYILFILSDYFPLRLCAFA